MIHGIILIFKEAYMTSVFYECVADDGCVTIVNTLQEAKDFVKWYGGTYTVKYSSYLSQCEGYARKGHRAGGKQKGIRL